MAAAKDILILGAGGNSIDVLDAMNETNTASKQTVYRCLGFLDDNRELWGRDIHGHKVLGPLASAADHPGARFVFTVASPFNFFKRAQIAHGLDLPLDRYETVVHPSAVVSRLAELGPGGIVLQNSSIASDARVGAQVMILQNAVVSHETVIGDYTCQAGGACVSGGVVIGQSCYLGTNAAVIGNCRVGDYCLVGMGAVVLRDIPENSVYVGNPARYLRPTR